MERSHSLAKFFEWVFAGKTLVDCRAIGVVAAKVNLVAMGIKLQKRFGCQKTPPPYAFAANHALKQAAAAAGVESGEG